MKCGIMSLFGRVGKSRVKMNKITYVASNYRQNEIFDVNNKLINRDNCAYSYFVLRNVFETRGLDLSTYDINHICTSRVVLYNDIPETLPKKEDIYKSYLIILESEVIKNDNWDLKKHAYFNKIFTWNDELVDNEKYFKINFSHLFPKEINKDWHKKTKLCILIAGNKRVTHPLELYSERILAIKWFEKFHPNDFDFYGIGWDNYALKNKYLNFIFNKFKLSTFFKPHYSSYGGKVDTKKDILEKYRFAICYENARDIPGYITEKIFDCFFAGCIPIYWGANNITEHIPKECFIDRREFSSYEALYAYMNNMADSVYLEYLNQIESYLKSQKSKPFSAIYFAETIVDTIVGDIEN